MQRQTYENPVCFFTDDEIVADLHGALTLALWPLLKPLAMVRPSRMAKEFLSAAAAAQ